MILDNENVEYDKEVVANFVTKHFPDNRRILNEIQRYSVNGKIDVGILSQVGDIQIKDLVKGLKEKDFVKVREWVVNNLNNDPASIYRKIYDGMYDIVKPTYIPELVITIAKYQYQTSFVADAEIQMIAFFVEVMANGEFK